MRDSIKIALGVILVVIVDVLLCLLIPPLALLKLFLTLAAILLITASVSMLNDLIHYHHYQQTLRMNKLEMQRRQLLPLESDSFHHHTPRCSRNIRSRCRR